MNRSIRLFSFGVLIFLVSILFWNGWVTSTAASENSLLIQQDHTPTPESTWKIEKGDGESEWIAIASGNSISGIAVDENYIWAASWGGLLRWKRDTGQLTQYLAPQVPLPSNNLHDVLLHNGKIYASGYGGLSIYDGEAGWIQYSSADIGLDIEDTAPIAMIDDVLWLGTEEGIARLYPDGHWEVNPAGENGLPEAFITEIISRKDGIFIVILDDNFNPQDQRVMQFQSGMWQEVSKPNLKALETPDGILWQARRDGMYKSTDHGTTWQLVMDGFNKPELRAVDELGRLYLDADDTIFVIADHTVVEEYRYTRVGPELSFVNIIEWDEHGRMWIATDGRGITMFDGHQWHNWQDGDSGLRNDCIRGLAIGLGRLYAGTHSSAGTGGVNIYDFKTEHWTNFWPGESELSGGGIDGIAVHPRGQVYFPTSSGILDIYHVQENSWEHIPMPRLENTILRTSEGLIDLEGNYWVGVKSSSSGLWMFNGQEWKTYSIDSDVSSLSLDSEGRLWLGTSEGLVVRDTDRIWNFYSLKQIGEADGRIEDIAIDPSGRAWMISYKNLVVFNGEEFLSLDPSLAGSSHWGDAVTIGPENQIWVEAGYGIAANSGELALGAFQGLKLTPDKSLPEAELVSSPEEFYSPDMPVLITRPTISGRLIFIMLITIGAGLSFICLLIIGLIVYFVLKRDTTGSDALPED